MSNETKRQLISAGITFISMFILTVIPVFTDPTFTLTGATITALLLTGVRSGVKAVYEAFLPKLQP